MIVLGVILLLIGYFQRLLNAAHMDLRGGYGIRN